MRSLHRRFSYDIIQIYLFPVCYISENSSKSKGVKEYQSNKPLQLQLRFVVAGGRSETYSLGLGKRRSLMKV